jgi:hypothetical protein
MPDWNQLLNEITAAGSVHDIIRRRYLKELHELTGRNVIIYYSGWLQKRNLEGVEVNDADKNGFMTVVHGLDRTKGLDLIYIPLEARLPLLNPLLIIFVRCSVLTYGHSFPNRLSRQVR